MPDERKNNMSIIRWSPMWDPFAEMDETLNRLPSLNSQMKAFVPAMDVYETDKAVVVETPLAGVNPDDVQVSVEKGVLTVQGENKKEHEVDEKNYYRKEIRSGSFFRQIALPAPVLEDKVTAEFEDGILKVSCPKAQPAKVKKVDVKIIKKNGKK
jgi:HSP20 family protein